MRKTILVLIALLVSITLTSQEVPDFFKAKKEYLKEHLSGKDLRKFKKLEQKLVDAQASYEYLFPGLPTEDEPRIGKKGECGYYKSLADLSWEEIGKPRYEEAKRKYLAFIVEKELDLDVILGTDDKQEILEVLEHHEEEIAMIHQED